MQHTVGSGIQRHARGMTVDESALLTTTQRKRRLEIAQPEMTKRFLLLHRLNIHIAVSKQARAWGLVEWNMEFHGQEHGCRTT